MMRSTSPCVDGLHPNANRPPVCRRTTTLKLGAVVGEHSGAKSTAQNERERHVDTTVVGVTRSLSCALWMRYLMVLG